MEFPLVAKAAIGADYDRISFPGKRKIWFIDDAAELAGIIGCDESEVLKVSAKTGVGVAEHKGRRGQDEQVVPRSAVRG